MTAEVGELIQNDLKIDIRGVLERPALCYVHLKEGDKVQFSIDGDDSRRLLFNGGKSPFFGEVEIDPRLLLQEFEIQEGAADPADESGEPVNYFFSIEGFVEMFVISVDRIGSECSKFHLAFSHGGRSSLSASLFVRFLTTAAVVAERSQLTIANKTEGPESIAIDDRQQPELAPDGQTGSTTNWPFPRQSNESLSISKREKPPGFAGGPPEFDFCGILVEETPPREPLKAAHKGESCDRDSQPTAHLVGVQVPCGVHT